ncbi:hypothetical protein ACC860_36725, partial [Rhizobium ruizarguesonis]
ELYMPATPRRRVLDAFLLEKAAYEIAYEARNRPKWLPIPLSGLTEIVSRLAGFKAGMLSARNSWRESDRMRYGPEARCATSIPFRSSAPTKAAA